MNELARALFRVIVNRTQHIPIRKLLIYSASTFHGALLWSPENPNNGKPYSLLHTIHLAQHQVDVDKNLFIKKRKNIKNSFFWNKINPKLKSKSKYQHIAKNKLVSILKKILDNKNLHFIQEADFNHLEYCS